MTTTVDEIPQFREALKLVTASLIKAEKELADLQKRHENFKANEARMREHYLGKLAEATTLLRDIDTLAVCTGHEDRCVADSAPICAQHFLSEVTVARIKTFVKEAGQ